MFTANPGIWYRIANDVLNLEVEDFQKEQIRIAYVGLIGGCKRGFLPVLAAASVLTLMGALLTACSSQTALVVLSAQHPETTGPLIAAFSARFKEQASVSYVDDATLVARVEAAGSSAGTVAFAENAISLTPLLQRGLLAELPPALQAEARRYFKEAYSGNTSFLARYVLPYSLRVDVLDYNTSRIAPSELPRHILELASPRFKGMIGMAPSEPDFVPVVAAVLSAYGPERTLLWLKGLKENADDHVYPDFESLALAINSGAVAFGFLNQYYWYRLKHSSPLKVSSAITYFAAGDPGFVASLSGLALIKGASGRSQAIKFLAFAATEDGQQALLKDQSFEYPLLASLAPPQLPPLNQAQLYKPPAPAKNLYTTVGDLLREAGLL